MYLGPLLRGFLQYLRMSLVKTDETVCCRGEEYVDLCFTDHVLHPFVDLLSSPYAPQVVPLVGLFSVNVL